MSYDFIIYARRDRLPSPESFASLLASASPAVLIEPTIPNPDRDGFVPVTMQQRQTGFEICYGAVTSDEADAFAADLDATRARGEDVEEGDLEHLTILRTCDVQIILGAHDPHEIEAANRVARALASVAGGYFCDPQEDLTIGPQLPSAAARRSPP